MFSTVTSSLLKGQKKSFKSFPILSREMAAGLDIDGAIWRCCEVDTHCSGVWGGLLEM